MVQAMINISEEANHILNIVKARHKLKDKTEAINFVTIEYSKDLLEPELRPEYVEKALKIDKQKGIFVGTIENLRKRYEK
ncbi:DUF2683 family protein [Candidatus Woesearchaeota archaeon]|nr:DUF2683 family protein [Candidatus Woesearchaeota archaeon]